MALTVTIANKIVAGSLLHVFGTITPSGSYVTGGEAPSWTALPTRKNPLYVHVGGKAGHNYAYDYANAKIMVFQGGAAVSNPEAQIPAAAYPGGVTGDTISFYAVFPQA